MNRKRTIPTLIMAAGIAVMGSAAYAKSLAAENDAIVDLARAKITLTQAVAAAEAHANGKATKAELEGENRTAVYEIEVVTTEKKVLDIKVDATNGKVLSSQRDQADAGEKEDDME